ncbi:unnamed protein product, partial [marine sediment metagenome]
LFWSWWAANSGYGFTHNNINLENIVLQRPLLEKAKMTFLVSNGDFTDYRKDIILSNIPTFINFDASSMLNINTQTNNLQSIKTMSPEILSYKVLNKTSTDVKRDACDVWSLTLTIFSFQTHNNTTVLEYVGKQHQKKYRYDFFKEMTRGILFPTLLDETKQEEIFTFMQIFFLQRGLRDRFGTFPPEKLLSSGYYNKRIFTKQLRNNIYKFDAKYGLYKAYKQFFINVIPVNIQDLVRDWLDWDPNVRTNNGNFIGKIMKHLVKRANSGL